MSINVPASTTLSVKSAGSNLSADSDGDPSNNALTDVMVLSSNTYHQDIDFALQLSGVEVCDNGIDDDGDGLSDCEDQACPKPNPVVRISID